MGVVNTTNTFASTDVITSDKMNNIIDETTFTNEALGNSTLAVIGGKLRVAAAGITSNELAANSVNQASIVDESITPSKINPSVIFMPAGAITYFAMATAPSGWLACDGSIVSRTTYSALFSTIGTAYGAGDGGTTFRLPDLRGYFLRGAGVNSDGVEGRTVGLKQANDIQLHSHTVVAGQQNGTSSGCGNASSFQKANDINCGVVSTSLVGGSETRPHNISLLACIKF